MPSSAALLEQSSTSEGQFLVSDSASGASATAAWDDHDYRNRYEVRLGTKTVHLLSSAGTLPAWLSAVARGLNRAYKLPANWDSYGAVPVFRPVLKHALAVILNVMTDRYPVPQINATPSGGICFEWHRLGRDVEIEIDENLRVEGYFFDEADKSAEWERELQYRPAARSRRAAA